MMEQLGWRAPDALVLPVGNGTLLLGAALAIADLRRSGLLDRGPRLIAVQAARCAPLWAAWSSRVFEGSSPTLAEGIAIAEPPRLAQMLAAVRESDGCVLTVSEGEIRDAWAHAATQGFYVESTTAAGLAGALRYAAQTPPDVEIATVFTGHGLKASAKLVHLT